MVVPTLRPKDRDRDTTGMKVVVRQDDDLKNVPIPVNIQDMVARMLNKNTRAVEASNLSRSLLAIKTFIEKALKEFEKQQNKK